ncbi:Spy/CpxP family protein refolding chaperone [Leptothermofonsia sp. ETS-13]|uniref:Spy/CpxP family protein refolding chaperone n=1 Tax=Leptothermofonsia sp. ETS-13 TaxID=3035696 RepID=UPI003BA09FD5
MFPRRIAAIAATVVILGGAIAISRPGALFSNQIAQVSRESKERSKGNWLKDLNLTPAQFQKIEAIRSRYKNDFTQQRQAVQQAQKELRAMLAGDTPVDQIRQKYNEVRTLKQRFADTRFNSLLETREVLNFEQRKKFVEHMRQKREGFRERFKDRIE